MIKIYTDGGCRPNPGTGSWGFVVVVDEKKVFSRSGIEKNTTNNRMEMKAILEALMFIESQSVPRSYVVYSDSALCVNSLTKWAKKWETKGWKKKKDPLKNIDLVVPAFHIFRSLDYVELKWIKGHSGNKWNDLVDEVCQNELRCHFQKVESLNVL